MSHTREPWPKPEYDNSDTCTTEWWEIPGVARVYSEHDARRILACVNELAGLTTEQIEDGAFTKMRTDRDALLHQRDELLEALSEIAYSHTIEYANSVAQQAIQKCEGKV